MLMTTIVGNFDLAGDGYDLGSEADATAAAIGSMTRPNRVTRDY